MTIIKTIIFHYAECNYAESRFLFIITLSVVMRCVIRVNVTFYSLYAKWRYGECCYAQCRYAECHYAECRFVKCCYGECRGALFRLYLLRHQALSWNCV